MREKEKDKKKFKKTEAFHHAILNPRPTKEVCV